MYATRIRLQPSGGMTFRVLPGSIVDIATYPFVPPSTMSGFLRRIAMLSSGSSLPETLPNTPETPYFVLPRHLYVTGALPVGWCGVHRTYRQGPQNLKHTDFSRLFRQKEKEKQESFQLHTWEYVLCDQMEGFILAESPESLAPFIEFANWGCKIGKEGYAVITSVEPPVLLHCEQKTAQPSTLVLPEYLPIEALYAPLTFFSLYHFVYKDEEDPSVHSSVPSAVLGYRPLNVAVASAGTHLFLEYWHNHQDIFIPKALVEQLQRLQS